MNRRFTFLVFLFLSLSICSSAQKFAFEYWHEGKIVLESADTLKGQVKYSMQDDVVQFRSKTGALETYTARKILYFEIFDGTSKQYRQFYSLPYSKTGGQYKAPVFFELLAEGKITMMSREVLETRTYSSFYYYGARTRIVLVDKYFLLKPDGTIQPFLGKKSDLLEMMGNKEEMVQKYSKENKLDFDKKLEVAQMVQYYNSLFQR